MTATRNSLPLLISALRLRAKDIAAWTTRSWQSVEAWHSGAHQPPLEERALLVTAVRAHARELLALAAAVEREGRRKR